MKAYQPTLKCVLRRVDAPATVYWITHAGGGINALTNRMRVAADAGGAEVWSLAMPAREELSEQSYEGTLNDLARAVAEAIADRHPRGTDSSPISIVGHSFGSVLAYRITCELIDRDIMPTRLVVMSSASPDRVSHDQMLHQLSDEELVDQVDRLFGGIPADIKNDKEAQKYFTPGLRLDLELLEAYQHADDAKPLPIPVTAVCGIDDRAVDVAKMQRWQLTTSAAFRLVAVPGNHFFPLSRIPEILKLATSIR